MMTMLLVQNLKSENDVENIHEFFEKYQIGKINTIEYRDETHDAIVKMDYWYANRGSENMHERIKYHGPTPIVYDDPEYFTVKFYQPSNISNSIDMDRNVIVKHESHESRFIQGNYEEDQEEDQEEELEQDQDQEEDLEEELEQDQEEEHVDDRNEYIANENNVYEYLEDEVIENSNNIEILYKTIEALKLQIGSTNKTMKSMGRRLGIVKKKTDYLYRHKPTIVKRSIWHSRLRSRH